MIQQTTLESWGKIRKEIGMRQRQIYDAIAILRYADNLTISKWLNIPINSVTPRTLELRKMGLIESAGIFKNMNDRNAIFWRIKE